MSSPHHTGPTFPNVLAVLSAIVAFVIIGCPFPGLLKILAGLVALACLVYASETEAKARLPRVAEGMYS